jgi:tRNA (cytidine/uridine-2'-O-)-methyltransferase
MQLGWLMFHIILFAPQIPPNTGNIIRLSANTGAQLHLIEPLGFRLDEKSCRRAGLDYHALADLHLHKNLDDCVKILGSARLFAITSHGTTSLFDQKFTAGDAFLFGSETAGLPETIHARFTAKQKLRLPMIAGNRSLNLANAASIVVYEAWRQTGFVTA